MAIEAAPKDGTNFPKNILIIATMIATKRPGSISFILVIIFLPIVVFFFLSYLFIVLSPKIV